MLRKDKDAENIAMTDKPAPATDAIEAIQVIAQVLWKKVGPAITPARAADIARDIHTAMQPRIADEQVTEALTAAIASGMQRGLKPSQIAREASAALAATPALAPDDAREQAFAEASQLAFDQQSDFDGTWNEACEHIAKKIGELQ